MSVNRGGADGTRHKTSAGPGLTIRYPDDSSASNRLSSSIQMSPVSFLDALEPQVLVETLLDRLAFVKPYDMSFVVVIVNKLLTKEP